MRRFGVAGRGQPKLGDAQRAFRFCRRQTYGLREGSGAARPCGWTGGLFSLLKRFDECPNGFDNRLNAFGLRRDRDGCCPCSPFGTCLGQFLGSLADHARPGQKLRPRKDNSRGLACVGLLKNHLIHTVVWTQSDRYTLSQEARVISKNVRTGDPS